MLMTTRLNPYLSFRDTAGPAMDFYHSVFGGELTRSAFGEMQMGGPGEQDKIMHAMLTTDAGLTLMAADTPDGTDLAPGSNIAVSLSGEDGAELHGYFDKLSQDGAVTMPLEKAPWGDSFGMCTDRFGISWMVNIAGDGS
jgi:PhnB protein